MEKMSIYFNRRVFVMTSSSRAKIETRKQVYAVFLLTMEQRCYVVTLTSSNHIRMNLFFFFFWKSFYDLKLMYL